VQDVCLACHIPNHFRGPCDAFFFHFAGRAAHHRRHACQNNRDKFLRVAIAHRQVRQQTLRQRRRLVALRSSQRNGDSQRITLLPEILTEWRLSIQRDHLPASLDLFKGNHSPGAFSGPGLQKQGFSFQDFHVSRGNPPPAFESCHGLYIHNQSAEGSGGALPPEIQQRLRWDIIEDGWKRSCQRVNPTAHRISPPIIQNCRGLT